MDEIMKKYPNDVKYVLKNGPRGNLNEQNTKYTAAFLTVIPVDTGVYISGAVLIIVVYLLINNITINFLSR